MTGLYIWQKPEWPSFRWDGSRIAPLLLEAYRKKEFFLGRISMLDARAGIAASTSALEDEIISSSSIEGMVLDRDSVRSSIMERLGLSTEGLCNSDRSTEGAVSILIDAVENRNQALTRERLFGWHSELFPMGFSDGRRILAGRWRQGEMFVVSGHPGKEIIHYEAPPVDRVDPEMDIFLDYVNGHDGTDPLIKAAVAHFWFVSIHPFADGNGRIARTVSEMLLARAENSSHRHYSISSSIMRHRDEYYSTLEDCQKGTLDISAFIEYFLRMLLDAIKAAGDEIDEAMRKKGFWDSVKMLPLNERQVRLINRLFDGFEGKLTAEKWARIAKCSHSTALRDINDLIGKGILEEDGGNTRNAGYRLKVQS